MAALVLTGCLATDPAAREARRQEKLAFANAVSGLVTLKEGEGSKLKCKSLGQVLGKSGLVPRSYDNDLNHATTMAKHEAVRAGGNAIRFISSLMSPEMPREVVVIAEVMDCGKIPKSTYKDMDTPAPVKTNQVKPPSVTPEPVKTEAVKPAPSPEIPESEQAQ